MALGVVTDIRGVALAWFWPGWPWLLDAVLEVAFFFRFPPSFAPFGLEELAPILAFYFVGSR